MGSLLESVGAHLSTTLLATSASCSVDALERVVHFTGAGADACFYANPSSTTATPTSSVAAAAAPSEGLRYWLNPSVRARPTIATCEITNLGAPFFSPLSTSVLRITASPLFRDGRCFPTRCVVSLATSAQRLDGVSVRPIVVKEWDLLSHAEAASSAVASITRTTEVPLRTLYHVASLMGSAVAEMGEVRLYLQLRFTGCTDSSDTHRIASVGLLYEQLGPAAEVLSMLQRRRQSTSCLSASAVHATPMSGSVFDTSTLVEEVEVTVASSSSSDVVAISQTPPRRPEKRLFIPAEGEAAAREEGESDAASPPHRSATKPRMEKSSSPDRHRSSTRRDSHKDTRTEREGSEEKREAAHSSGGGRETELVRVERALRLPPDPPFLPPSHASTASPHRTAVERTPLRGAPLPPRKMRTIVLAPSISPSLSSASSSSGSVVSSCGSPLPSPGSGTSSTPRSRSSVACAATPLAGVEKAAPPAPVATQTEVDEWHHAHCLARESDPQAGQRPSDQRLTSAKPSSLSPPPRQRSASAADSDMTDMELFSREAHSRERSSSAGVSNTRSNAAVLWEATSLLGTAPWMLRSLQSSRRASSVASAHSSRASSRERSSGIFAPQPAAAAEAAAGTQSGADVSFLPIAESHISVSEAAGAETSIMEQESPPLPATPSSSQAAAPPHSRVLSNTRSVGWKHASDRPEVTTTANMSFSQWRSALASEATTRVSPQLNPPRSVAWQTSGFVASSSPSLYTPAAAAPSRSATIATNSGSVYVPRLSFRNASQRQDVLPSLQPREVTNHQSSTVPARTTPPPPPPLPSQNKNLWPNAAARATAKAPTHAQYVVAEYGQPSWLRKQSATSKGAASAAALRGAASAETVRSASGGTSAFHVPLSVIPAAWLEDRKIGSKPPNPKHHGAPASRSQKSDSHTLATTSTTAPSKQHEATSSLPASSPADAFLAGSLPTAAAPPPPSSPPPQSRVLVHESTSSLNSSRSSASSRPPSVSVAAAAVETRLSSPPAVLMTQRNDADETPAVALPPPTLPLQEHRHLHHRRGRAANSNDGRISHRDPQRRSRSAPECRSARSSSSSAYSVAPRVAHRHREALDMQGEVQSFAVLKHHASRSSVGRRRLTIRPVTSRSAFLSSGTAAIADPSDVCFFIALEKTSGVAQLRDSIGFKVKGGKGGSATHCTACEVPILRGDHVEVWTGVQAFNSGVIHKKKVHRVECCLVIRCNRQLVTAVEMETAEEVGRASNLLQAKR